MALFTLLALLSISLISTAPAHASGIALTYSPAYASHAKTWVSAQLTLPAVTSNRSWYCVWLMLIKTGASDTAPFIQGGLMRWDKWKYALSPFIAIKRRGDRDLTYIDLPPLEDQDETHPHAVAIEQRDDLVNVLLDGRVIFTDRSERYFAHDAVYTQLGAEVSRAGDTASGMLGDLLLSTAADDPPHIFDPIEQHIDHGLFLTRTGNRYHAAGTFDAKFPECYRFRFDIPDASCGG